MFYLFVITTSNCEPNLENANLTSVKNSLKNGDFSTDKK